ncbi:MAG: carboxypeptidase-like regulatory domain-containing protein [Nitrososphaeraceae archaeon]
MTLVTKSAKDDEKMLVDQEISHKLKTGSTVLVILINCLGAYTVIMISELYGPIISIAPISFKETVTSTPDIDLGSVKGLVIGSDGSPVDGTSVVAYKQMGLINSEVKNAGYSSSVVTKSDGSYLFTGLPSRVYKFEVTFSDNTIQILDNYAVWPSSSSSYDIKENLLLTK